MVVKVGEHGRLEVTGMDIGEVVRCLQANQLGFAALPDREHPQGVLDLIADDGGITVPEPFLLAKLYKIDNRVVILYDTTRPYVKQQVEALAQQYPDKVTIVPNPPSDSAPGYG